MNNNGLRRTEIISIIILSLIGTIIGLQGWQSRTHGMDLSPCLHSAAQFWEKGTIPKQGMLNSFASYNPPGTNLLYIPGVLFFDDPILFDYPVCTFFYIGINLGIFLLVRSVFGKGTAYFAVILFAFSSFGIESSTSLWSRYQMPFFYVWIVYCLFLWIRHNNGWFLTAAIVFLGFGAYTFLEILPVLFLFPLFYWMYKRPFSWIHLFTGTVIVILIWNPYLLFDSQRGFQNLRSQFFRQSVLPTDYKDAWCNPDLTVYDWNEGQLTKSNRLFKNLDYQERIEKEGNIITTGLAHIVTVFRGMNFNFGFLAPIPILILLLYFTLLASCIFMLIPHLHRSLPISFFNDFPQNFSHSIRQPFEFPLLFIFFSFFVPLIVLGIIAEVGRVDRFAFLWPFQCILIAAFVMNMIPSFNIKLVYSLAIRNLLIILTLCNTVVLGRADSWMHHGWSGERSPKREVVDLIAQEIQNHDIQEPAIGYQIFFMPYIPAFHIRDEHYKVGRDIDNLFHFLYTIENHSQCAEGFSDTDHFRILQKEPIDYHQATYNKPAPSNYSTLKMIDVYEIYIADRLIK